MFRVVIAIVATLSLVAILRSVDFRNQAVILEEKQEQQDQLREEQYISYHRLLDKVESAPSDAAQLAVIEQLLSEDLLDTLGPKYNRVLINRLKKKKHLLNTTLEPSPSTAPVEVKKEPKSSTSVNHPPATAEPIKQPDPVATVRKDASQAIAEARLKLKGKQFKEITLSDGIVRHDLTFVSADNIGATFTYANGVLRVPYPQLPKDIQELCHYDSQRSLKARTAELKTIAKQYEKLHQRELAQIDNQRELYAEHATKIEAKPPVRNFVSAPPVTQLQTSDRYSTRNTSLNSSYYRHYYRNDNYTRYPYRYSSRYRSPVSTRSSSSSRGWTRYYTPTSSSSGTTCPPSTPQRNGW